jgi:predicted phage tail protein
MLRAATLTMLLCSAHAAYAQSPSAPQNLTSTVNGTTVTLTWTASAGAASYVVEASVAPGGPLVASLPVGATSVTVPNVPFGTYFVRVRAVSGGTQSAPSNEVTVSVGGGGGCPGPPPQPQLSVAATGLDVTLNWTSAGGCPATSYVVQAGSAIGLSNIAVVNVGAQTGLAATAPAGVYFIRVIATNAFGATASEERSARVGVNAFTQTIPPSGAVAFDVVLTASGNFLGVLTWIDPTIDLDLYLTSAGCAYPPTGCLLAISDASGVNLEQVSLPVIAGQTYRLWVDNFSTRATSFSIENSVGGSVTPVAPPVEAGSASDEPRRPKVKP